jgi:hypothetical protein
MSQGFSRGGVLNSDYARTDIAETFDDDLIVAGTFTSLGIDDNATGERLQIADTILTLGVATATYNLAHAATDALLTLSGGTANDGGNIRLFGSTRSTLAGDLSLRSDANAFLEWDESAGELEIKTGTGSKTSALIIDSSQDATFAGNIDSKSFTSSSAAVVMRVGAGDLQLGENTTAEAYNVQMIVDDGVMRIGGGSGSRTGASLRLYGGAHASTASDWLFRSVNRTWMAWDESNGDLEISTGAGVKTSAMTISSAQNTRFEGAVDIFRDGAQLALQRADTPANYVQMNLNAAGDLSFTITGAGSERFIRC